MHHFIPTLKVTVFFRGYDYYENRAEVDINDNGEIGNWGIGQTVPLGSGLLVLVAAGDTVNLRGNYAKYDWGVYCSYTGASPYKINNGGEYSWRLLTEKEDTYILGPNTNPRPGSNCRRSSTVNGVPNARFIKARLTNASNGNGLGLNGIIIFPDTYIHPSSDLAPLPTKINDPNSTFTDNNYTIAQWTAMETAKAVFLPAAGCRWGAVGKNGVKYYKVQDINKHCYYWSSTDDASHESTHAKNMRI